MSTRKVWLLILIMWALQIFPPGLAFMFWWNWFIAPLTSQAINLMHACGIAIIIELWRVAPSSDGSAEKLGEITGGAIIRPLVIIAIGYLLHLFM